MPGMQISPAMTPWTMTTTGWMTIGAPGMGGVNCQIGVSAYTMCKGVVPGTEGVYCQIGRVETSAYTMCKGVARPNANSRLV